MPKPAALRSALGWLMADRVLRLLATAPITLFVARSLGPEEFGRLGLALGIVGIAVLTTQLGLDRILRRDLAEAPGQAPELLGTAAGLILVTALAAMGVVSLYALQGVEDPGTRRLILILAWGVLPQVFAPADYWFQSVHHPRVSVLARNLVMLGCAGLRVIACLLHWDIAALAWIAVAEWGLSGTVVALLLYLQPEAPRALRFSFGVAGRWLREAWPAFLVLLLGAAFERVDLLTLQHLAPRSEAGYYTAAQRFSELWWSLSSTIATALLPWLSRMRQTNAARYRQGLQEYLDLSVGATVAVAVICSVLAPLVLPWLLGGRYVPSVPVLVLLCWSAVPVYVETARSQYLLVERKLHIDVVINVFHMAATAVLCWWAVPRWGAVGVAAVRCGCYSVVAWIVPWCVPSLRPFAVLEWRAFLFFTRPGRLIEMVGRLWRRQPERVGEAATSVTVST